MKDVDTYIKHLQNSWEARLYNISAHPNNMEAFSLACGAAAEISGEAEKYDKLLSKMYKALHYARTGKYKFQCGSIENLEAAHHNYHKLFKVCERYIKKFMALADEKLWAAKKEGANIWSFHS